MTQRLRPPAHLEWVSVGVPAPHVLLVALNRPKALNAMSQAMQEDVKAVLDWFEDEPELWHVFRDTSRRGVR
jgi:enoyl-CoA hydratase/carnithine racemase